jgi:hypothetical protein
MQFGSVTVGAGWIYYAIELFCCVVEHEIEEAVVSAGQEIDRYSP